MISKVKRSYPGLMRYAEQKARRKFKTKPKLCFTRKGRIGSCTLYRNGSAKISVSRKTAKKNPILCKAFIVHELTEALTRSHKQALKIEGAYLKKHGTSYRKEAMRYRRS